MKPAISAKVIWHNIAHKLTLSRIYTEREAYNIASHLLEHSYQINLVDILADKTLKPKDLAETWIQQAIDRLLQQEPYEYIIGQAFFMGLALKVSPAVLIPRPETEELVAWIVSLYSTPAPLRILDIGTGSGCIALALKKYLPHAEVHAIDISPEALQVAQQNAQNLGLTIHWHQGNILALDAWLQTQNWDLIVSNPPYISPQERQEMQPNVLNFEPHIALFAPEDLEPTIFYEVITHYALKNLAPKGSLFFELNSNFYIKITEIIQKIGLKHIELKQDMQNKWRMLRAVN